MKIVLTGSLGHIGKPLTQKLVETHRTGRQKDHEVTVISSNPERQKEIEAIGAKAAIGSVEDTAFLTTTFAGVDAVFCMIPPNFNEPDQVAYYRRIGSNFIQAIRQAGVPHVVHLSSIGAHLEKGTGFIVGSYEVEQMLNKLSDTSVTHIRPGYFYYNLFSFIKGIKSTGFIAANFGENDRLAMASPQDIAAIIAEEIVLPDTKNKIRNLVSDDLPCNEVARILGNAIGQPNLKWKLLTDEQMQTGLETADMPSSTATTLVELGATIHSGILREDFDLHPSVNGKVKLTAFAKDFAVAFNKV